jgi:TRAP-type mannitol/chloroaromatic compound transport system permease large subunit
MYDDHMMMMPFVPLLVFTIPLAIGNAFLARRLGRSVAWWVILSLIPGINFIFFYYVAYIVVFAVLDRLKAIGDDMKRPGPASV